MPYPMNRRRFFLTGAFAAAAAIACGDSALAQSAKLPFPTVYRMEEIYAVWRLITARVLWIAASDSVRHSPLYSSPG